jgi:hypothetical protein
LVAHVDSTRPRARGAFWVICANDPPVRSVHARARAAARFDFRVRMCEIAERALIDERSKGT